MWRVEADTVTALTSLLRWAYGKVGLNEDPKFDPNMPDFGPDEDA